MKILALDFETSYNLALTWGLYDGFIPHENVLKERGILMGSYTYLNPLDKTHSKIRNISLLNSTDEDDMINKLYLIMLDADIIVTHNGDKFDLRRFNTELIKHNFDPLPKIKTIDTLKIARKNFNFNSNKLADLARTLGLGEKGDVPKSVWIVLGNPNSSERDKRQALKLMRDYCNQDVVLLAKLYFALRRFDPSHPSFNLVADASDACPRCTSQGTLETNPAWVYHSATRTYPRFKCTNCGGWTKGVKSVESTLYTAK